eukprot:CAMPEP_0117501540 /NCGR_PEP_ID=MMETSP0784-20121206/23351_1 /TAXON_ID=39447 /ORGANISM="" /LENGTH=274 /DNA_ID=CAMNT_0005296797 /DNA_START=71 /DNA_END=895 /DNA_ORIENTATION=+
MVALGVRHTLVKRKAAAKTPPAIARPLKGKTSGSRRTQSITPRASSQLALMKAVVINLKVRDDRWRGIQKSASRNAPWLRMERIDAVDGRISPPAVKDVEKKWSTDRLAQMFHWYRPKTIQMSPGERGCCASHLKAWRMCAAGRRPLIVLEDDAVILPSFTSTLEQAMREAPKGTGAIWLTSKDRGTRKRVGSVLMEPSYVWTTVGYVIWPSAARTLMKLLPMDMPVDNFMAWHIKEGQVRTYSVLPAAVRQAQTWNIGSDVPHSDDVALWNAD